MNLMTKTLIGSAALIAAMTVAACSEPVVSSDPLEARVVEIHMTPRGNAGASEKQTKRKAEKLPYLAGGTCSGSFINADGDILTARHCVEDNPQLEIITYDKRRYAGVLVATSALHDLAVIHIDRRNTPHFSLATSVTRGEPVFVLGSPLGITDTLSAGLIARLDGDVTFIDCAALPGNSGSAVFNIDGKMVGVLNAGLIVFMGTTHLNVMQGLDAISFFLEEVERKRE